MPKVAPKGWNRVAFGDVVRQVRDRVDPKDSGLERYVAGEHMDTDDLRIRKWGEIGEGYLGPAFHMRFKPGHVLYGSRRTYLRKVAVADFEGITANTTFVIESTDPKVLLPELLPFIMQTEAFHSHSVKQSKGSVNPYINFSDLTWYEFALPPLDEQRKLVEVLMTISVAQESLRTTLSTAKAARQALLQTLFPSSLLPNDGLRSLESVALRVSDGTHLPPQFSESGIPFLLVSNIRDGKIDWKVEKYVAEDVFKDLTRSWRPQREDVLYSLVGSFGMPAMVETDDLFTFQRHIGLIRTDPTKLLPRYLYWYLRSSSGLRQAHFRAEGLAQKTITLAALRSFQIRVPARTEQLGAVVQLDILQDAITQLDKRANAMGQIARAAIAGLLNERW